MLLYDFRLLFEDHVRHIMVRYFIFQQEQGVLLLITEQEYSVLYAELNYCFHWLIASILIRQASHYALKAYSFGYFKPLTDLLRGHLDSAGLVLVYLVQGHMDSILSHAAQLRLYKHIYFCISIKKTVHTILSFVLLPSIKSPFIVPITT